MRTPFWTDLERKAITFEDFRGRVGCASSPPLVCRSWVSEASAILPSANSWNRLLAIRGILKRPTSRRKDAESR